MGTARETVRRNINALVDYEKSPTAFADRVGVSRQSVNNWTKGANAPDIEMIAVIARAYNVPLSAMLEHNVTSYLETESYIPSDTVERDQQNETGDKLSADEKKLVGLYRQMSKEDKKTFMKSAQLFAVASEAKGGLG